MSDKLKTVEISPPGAAIKMTRTEVPSYVQQAIAESFERGKRDAQASKNSNGSFFGRSSSAHKR
jgi:hypothetical protein